MSEDAALPVGRHPAPRHISAAGRTTSDALLELAYSAFRHPPIGGGSVAAENRHALAGAQTRTSIHLHDSESIMKNTLVTTCFVIGTVLTPVAVFAADSDADRSKPEQFVKDSAITTKIKTKLAAEHPESVAHIRIDTDRNGVVWISGTADSKQDADRAVAIARETEGVRSVRSDIKVTH
jgi:hyperosmotically inducible protein